MTRKLYFEAILKISAGIALVAVLLFLSMPVVLGSVPAFLVFLCYPFIIAKRIRNEEEVLARDLPGYKEYLRKVRWRLIPHIW